MAGAIVLSGRLQLTFVKPTLVLTLTITLRRRVIEWVEERSRGSKGKLTRGGDCKESWKVKLQRYNNKYMDGDLLFLEVDGGGVINGRKESLITRTINMKRSGKRVVRIDWLPTNVALQRNFDEWVIWPLQPFVVAVWRIHWVSVKVKFMYGAVTVLEMLREQVMVSWARCEWWSLGVKLRLISWNNQSVLSGRHALWMVYY